MKVMLLASVLVLALSSSSSAQSSDDTLLARLARVEADQNALLKQMNAVPAEQAAQRSKIENVQQDVSAIRADVKAIKDALNVRTQASAPDWPGATTVTVVPTAVRQSSSVTYSSTMSTGYGMTAAGRRTPVRSFLRRVLTLGGCG